MASYNGTVILSGMISPTDTTDKYPTHEDKLGKGGYMSVADTTERDNIPSLRRKVGMMVYAISTDKMFQLVGGIENINWIDFSSKLVPTSTGELVLSTIVVSGFITSLFNGVTIPQGEILYTIGNEYGIDTNVYNGLLSTVLSTNKTHDFIIVYNGTSSSVYVNNNIVVSNIQNIISSYPRDYISINLVTNPLSNKLKTVLSETRTTDLQVYLINGIMSTINKEQNTFKALNNGADFVAIFDGINYSAYRKSDVTINDLQSRVVIG